MAVVEEARHHRFAAMGTRVHVVVDGVDSATLLTSAVAHIDELEARWSRFRPTSDVTLLNSTPGSPSTVDPTTVQLVERAVTGWRLTGGRFDPTLLDDLIGLGYDRPFDLGLDTDRRPRGARTTPSPGSVTCDHIVVDRAASTVGLPPGLTFDPGGIGKGLAADLVSARLIERGATRALVNIGGDLRLRSTEPDATPWTISIDEPSCGAAPPIVVRLVDGAVATSTTQKRRWRTGDGDRHHVLDPATGTSRIGGPVLASVVATDGWWAEVASTALFDPRCPALPGAVTRRVFADGVIECHPDFVRYTA